MTGLERNHRKSSEEKSLSTNNTENRFISDKNSVAEGPLLANKIPQISKTFDQYFSPIYFSPKQFGFPINTSTEHAILELVRNITKSFENNEYVLGVFIELKKAFDTVNHEMLLHKLKLYGINGTCLEWFKSYLSIHRL